MEQHWSRRRTLIGVLTLLFSVAITQSISDDPIPSKWAVQFDNDHYPTDVLKFADEFGLRYDGVVGVLDDVHLFSTKAVDDHQKRGLQFQSYLEGVVGLKRDNSEVNINWYETQIKRKREKREVLVKDPRFIYQWHLHNTSSVKNAHINSENAWNLGYMGEGIVIGIVDDGIQTTHPDLVDNILLEASYNFNEDIPSPDPTHMKGSYGDWHGTASAGVAAARDDGSYCGVGVAPRASLAGLAILQNNVDVDDATEAKALSYKNDIIDIYSNSWGPIQPGHSGHKNEGPGKLAFEAMEKSINEGRKGLGNIYVWASGNDGNYGDNCNYDGYANLRYTILVGASDAKGRKAYYSEPCTALFMVTPGGNPSNYYIETTDLMGTDGVGNSDCSHFAGTSASCPMGAGVVALVLEANSNLSWLEVQYVLVDSMWQLDASDSSWQKNGGGNWVSPKYGFGIPDSAIAVEVAKNFNRSIDEITETFTMDGAQKAKSLGHSYIIESEILVDFEMKIHHVEIILTTTHQYIDKMTIELISPYGTKSVLATPHSDKLSKWDNWMFMSNMHWGEDSYGTWKIKISDTEEQPSAELSECTLNFYGIEFNASSIENQTGTNNSDILSALLLLILTLIFV
eukprot:TRINITY_DN10116_c0_g1_i1.p1 TRINITY_DN10116_c0_g1~~TRINITY_DN10116_c0_g1_i1.p1  ORF type:complete len:626 (-),score=151.30 TRINITY_DN10116_c0_g1_i1:56-1933(-)